MYCIIHITLYHMCYIVQYDQYDVLHIKRLIVYFIFYYVTGDVGALSEVRDELLHNVLEPIAHPERVRSLGLEVPAGVLFFGPPGLVPLKLKLKLELKFFSFLIVYVISSSLLICSLLSWSYLNSFFISIYRMNKRFGIFQCILFSSGVF